MRVGIVYVQKRFGKVFLMAMQLHKSCFTRERGRASTIMMIRIREKERDGDDHHDVDDNEKDVDDDNDDDVAQNKVSPTPRSK